MNYILVVDSNTDLPKSFVDKNNVGQIYFTYNFKGKEYLDDFGASLNHKEFYSSIKSGEMPTTSLVPVLSYEKEFRKHIEAGLSVVYISFSSALSGSYNSACLAANNIKEEIPSADIVIVDSLSASLGEGLFVWYLVNLYNSGASKDELLKWIEDNVQRVNHYFTVDDLNHLRRGGRVSGVAAFIGTILEIKPVLKVDELGRLIPVEKVKGRKKSLKRLFEYFKERVEFPDNQTIAISHADAEEDAKYVEGLIREEFNIGEVIINNIGPTVGSHSGPGTVALFFLGKKRCEE